MTRDVVNILRATWKSSVNYIGLYDTSIFAFPIETLLRFLAVVGNVLSNRIITAHIPAFPAPARLTLLTSHLLA